MVSRFGLLALVGLLVAPPAAGQDTARRPVARTFRFSLAPYIGLGFRGVRAVQDPMDGTCVSGPCVDHKIGSGPLIGADAQLPLFGSFGLGLSASASRPSRLVCTPNCGSRAKVTLLRGSVMALVRLKARVPVFFGLGATIARSDSGAVQGQAAQTEIGGILQIGYDLRPAEKIGARVVWSNYFLKPSDNSLPSGFDSKNFTHDAVISVGVRISP